MLSNKRVIKLKSYIYTKGIYSLLQLRSDVEAYNRVSQAIAKASHLHQRPQLNSGSNTTPTNSSEQKTDATLFIKLLGVGVQVYVQVLSVHILFIYFYFTFFLTR